MRFAPAVILLSGLAFTASVHAAHDDEREGRRRGGREGREGRVTFYQDADFRGGSITLEAGEEIDNLTLERFSNGGGANDRISSVRIDGRIEVTVYRDARFRGATRRFTQDVRNLAQDGGAWNDIISSIRTEARRPGEARAEQAETDRTIERIFRETLGRRPDQSALRNYRTRMIEDGWSEKDVRDELRRTDEYRTVVDRVITKAYRELLGRNVDPDGLRSYTQHMLRDGWSEDDVRKSIRESQEYRERPRG
jgi:hypothetical protein